MRVVMFVVALVASLNVGYWLYWSLAAEVIIEWGSMVTGGIDPDGWVAFVVKFLVLVGGFKMTLDNLDFLVNRLAGEPTKSTHDGSQSKGKSADPSTPKSISEAWGNLFGVVCFPFILWGANFIFCERPERTFQHSAGVASVAFSPDGKTLVTGGSEGNIRLWEAGTGRLIGFATHVDSLDGPAVAFAPDGKGFWSCGDNSLEFWNVDLAKAFLEQYRPGGRKPGFLVSGLPARRLASTTAITAFALSPTGDFALAATGQGAIRWDLQDGKTSFFFRHGASVNSLAWHPNEMTIATGGRDNSVRLWDSNLMGFVNRDRLIKDSLLSLKVPGRVRALAFRPDGKSIATGGDDRTVRLWDLPTGNPKGPVLEHAEEVTAVAFNPDGTLILTACGNFEKRRGEARLWSAASGKQLGRFRHKHLVTCLAFSPDGEEFVTGSEDKSVKLWKVPKIDSN